MPDVNTEAADQKATAFRRLWNMLYYHVANVRKSGVLWGLF